MPPLKYFAPNSFTAASLVLGLASVVCSTRGEFELAAWMILWGTLFDKADGTVARLCNATSEFGVQFDSFADFVSFGIAPAALVYFKLAPTSSTPGFVAAASALYTVALSVRLARFNITTGGEGVFFGIPGTFMGALVGSSFLTAAKYGMPESVYGYFPSLLVVGAFAMVSTVRLPKLKPRENKAMNAFQTLNVLAAYIAAPFRVFPEYMLGLALVYLVGGMVYCLLHPEAGLPEAVTDEPKPGEGGQLAA
ncbi:MAG: CDP-alcohol phosphatidyltransferase family protein [Deltaproteobacteria bacterium]|nr:CDP-alcohol phosphatidyltransferase family protein [Deltaproteobacteria bacterium]